MKTVILCGGRGMRLNEETEYRPKPLVPVGGQPILSHIMRTYAHFGFREFVLCLGYRGDMIKDYFLRYEAMNNDFTVRLGCRNAVELDSSHRDPNYCVTLADTGLETMTGGRVKRIQRYINEETFMLTYGDGVADIDIEALLKFHNSHGHLATLTAVHPISRFGMLEVNKEGRISKFSEKPMMADWMNAGFFVFNWKVFDYLGENCVMEDDALPRLADEGELMAYKHDGFFFAMDTYRDYRYLNDLWDKGQTPWVR